MSTVSTIRPRGRITCLLAGWLHYVVGFFGGFALGVGIDACLDLLAGRSTELSSWYYVQHTLTSVVILGGGGATLLGLWMGWRSYAPARDAAAGLHPRPSRPLQWMLDIQARGPIRLLRLVGELLHARFVVLTGESPPFRIVLIVLAVLLLGGVGAFTVFVGRDSEMYIAGYIGGGVAALIADCLLVNRIAAWRVAGRLTPTMSLQ